jgi:alpha-ketoglutarate-dependent taurine dioxygenase
MTTMQAVQFSIDTSLRAVMTDNSVVHCSRFIGAADELRSAVDRSAAWRLVASSDGEISVVEDRGAPEDYSSNGAFFAAHTDGLVGAHPPQFVALLCDHPGRVAAPTFFLDTTRVLALMARHAPTSLAVLRRLDQVFISRGGSEYRRPVIESNPLDGEDIMNITFGRAYLRPARHLEGNGQAPHQVESVTAFQALLSCAEDVGMTTHEWQRGDLLVWDNHRFVHGRGDATAAVGRRLIRAWLNPR